jgi:hypothetical protein
MQGVAAGAAVALNPADAARPGRGRRRPGDRAQHVTASITWRSSLDPTVKAGAAWIPESLPGAPVGALLNGGAAVCFERNRLGLGD